MIKDRAEHAAKLSSGEKCGTHHLDPHVRQLIQRIGTHCRQGQALWQCAGLVMEAGLCNRDRQGDEQRGCVRCASEEAAAGMGWQVTVCAALSMQTTPAAQTASSPSWPACP